MTRGLEGKVAVVTGGSRGIGRAIAYRLAREGALVAVHYGRDRAAASEVVRVIEEGGGRAFAVQAEFGKPGAVATFYQGLDTMLRERTGSEAFDILVNNAGIAPPMELQATSESAFDELIAVNVKTPFFLVQKAVGRLRDGGRIINLSSGVSRLAYPEAVAYALTKGALDNFTLAMAWQLGPRGITVNSLAPGYVQTDMNPSLSDPEVRRDLARGIALGRVGQPDDIADVAAFLASSDGRWVTGTYVDATGGSLLGRRL
ncbi:3-oxoacyl-[acyl-carrier protein] reductase [Labilithrix luteola]|uniref:3-oxoacyl-[acyl-carrier protein] reductase n=1 Tax=Labilithrix luteola TaxID=1391654 RepID=A0A0K1PY10_9BACT|nr:SDR family oxidoreductase [Labilithrix luteola]AKU98418.1 3-oxoacyl-[acyl-carrier protein] reductase [Labilithrix luteola]